MNRNKGKSWGNKDTRKASEARKRKIVMVSGLVTKVFSSIREASEITGCHEPAIFRCCNGKQGKTCGVTFRYFEDFGRFRK